MEEYFFKTSQILYKKIKNMFALIINKFELFP